MKILIGTFTFYPEGNGVAEVAGKAALGSRFKGQVEACQDFVASFQCDVMVFHCWNSWPLDLALSVARRNPAKKVIVSHSYSPHIWHPSPRFAWGLGAWARLQPYFWSFPRQMAKVDHLVVLSEHRDFGRFLDRTLMGLLRDPRWSAIPNGASIRLAPADLSDFRAQYGIAPGELLVLHVANYCDRKNQIAALRAFAKAKVPNAVLVFIGSEENEYALRLKQRLREMEGEALRVLILDHVPKEMIFAAYRAADLFVLSSKVETQPLALLDAMACGFRLFRPIPVASRNFRAGRSFRRKNKWPERSESLRATRLCAKSWAGRGFGLSIPPIIGTRSCTGWNIY